MKDSYRGEFKEKATAEGYEQDVFSLNSYASLLWTLERQYLDGFLQHFPLSYDEIDYLDFASGTGRVLSFMESRVARARGVEISAAMLEIARQKVERAELVQADLTAANAPVEGRYDLITAFRFFLNAEPALRLKAMRALAVRLKDDRSRLIFNVHASIPSHKLLLWPKHRLQAAISRQQGLWNYMTQGQVRQLLGEAGLEIEEVFGYDLFSGKSLYFVSYDKLLTLEQRLAGQPLIQRLGAHQLYVARRRF